MSGSAVRVVRYVSACGKCLSSQPVSRLVLAILWAILLTSVVSAQTSIPGDTISFDTTWTVAGSPYQVSGPILVESGATLTMEPGVVLEFCSNHGLEVDGTLEAFGTNQDTIVFRKCDSNPTGWQGIVFDNSANAGSMAYCRVTDSKNSAVRIYNCLPSFDNCEFAFNRGAVGGAVYANITNSTGTDSLIFRNCDFLKDTATSSGGAAYIQMPVGTIVFDSCDVSDNIANPNESGGNYYGGGLYIVTSSGHVDITGSSISGNRVTSSCGSWNCSVYVQGGGLYLLGDATIRGTTISHNRTHCWESGIGGRENGFSYGAGIFLSAGNLLVQNSRIDSNTTSVSAARSRSYGAGMFANGGEVWFQNTSVSGNTSIAGYYEPGAYRSGTGVFLSSDSARFTNCVFANNSHHGIYVNSGAAFVENSIVYFNNPSGSMGSYGTQIWGSATASYSNVQGGFAGVGMIDCDPMFTFGSPLLDPASCCIDSGNPSPEYNDICFPPSMGTDRNDMGIFGGPGACDASVYPRPLLVSPADGALDVSIPVTLSWDEVPEAISYAIQISTDSFFDSIAVQETALEEESLLASSLQSSTTYFWRVITIGQSGVSDWSDTRQFTTASCLSVSPGSISFGSKVTNTTGTRVITVSNDGCGPIEIQKILPGGINPDYFLIDRKPFVLDSGESRQLTIQFRPKIVGSFNAEINIETGAETVQVLVSGAGINPVTSDHTTVFRNATLNGQEGVINVSPGAGVTLSYGYSTWSRSGCPGCIIWHALGVEGDGQDTESIGIPGRYPGRNSSASASLAAPSSPGVYGVFGRHVPTYTSSQAIGHYEADFHNDSYIPLGLITVVDPVAPPVPAGLMAQNATDSVVLTWNAITHPTTKKIHVYRGVHSDALSWIGSLDPTAVTYVDQDVRLGIDYCYRLRISDSSDVWSGYTPSSCVRPDSIHYSRPDLEVTHVTLPSDGWTGEAIDVEWTVHNVGDTVAYGTWIDHVYISLDTVFGNADDVFGGSFEFPNNLEIGESYTHIHPVELPYDSPGSYHVIVFTNSLGTITEQSFPIGNIVVSDSSTQAMQSPYPDLAAGGVTTIASAKCGEHIPVSWTTTNNGSGATDAPMWYDRLYLSTDTIYSSSDKYLGRFQNFSYLAPGQSYLQSSRSVKLPWHNSGSRYVLVVADGDNHVDEHSQENNNAAYSISQIDIVDSLPPTADLSVAATYVPSFAWAGAPIRVNWTVSNLGSAAAAGQRAFDWIMISTDSIPGSNDLCLCGYPDGYYKCSDLQPGQSYSRSKSSPNLPGHLDGDYFLFVWTDIAMRYTDADLSNNFSDPIRITISPRPNPDLDPLSVSASVPGLNSGDDLELEFLVVNYGPGPTPHASWTDGIYLSEDSAFDPGVDINISNQSFSGDLPLDSSYDGTGWFTVPNQLSGDYFPIVFVDRYGNLTEEFENNNIQIAEGPVTISFTPPDLVPASLAVAEDTVWSGMPVSISWITQNTGPGRTAPSAWTDEVYLSSDTSLDIGSDLLLGRSTHQGRIDAGEQASRGLSQAIPDGLEGDYFVIVQLDADNDVFEDANEGNNTAQLAISITLTPPPDLQVAQIDAADTLWTGKAYEVNWTVSNLGAGTTRRGSWTDQVYLSEDEFVSKGEDLLLATIIHNGDLDTTEQYSSSANVWIPEGLSDSTDEWYVVVAVDTENDEYEHLSETNNVAASTTTVALTPSPDLRIIALEADSSGLSGFKHGLFWRVGNVGDGPTLDDSWIDRVYLSSNSSLDVEGDTEIYSREYNGTLAIGDAYTRNVDVSLPSVSSGEYFLKVFTDADNGVYEHHWPPPLANWDENNIKTHPISITQPTPQDLKWTNLTNEGIFIGVVGQPAGDTMTVGWRVRNVGQYATLGNVPRWTDAVYLSTDTVLNREDDLWLGQKVHFGILPPDSAYSGRIVATMPNTVEGEYYIIRSTDDGQDLGETDETDNTAYSVVVFVQEPPDLVIDSVWVPDSIISGQKAILNWVVKNDGIGETKEDRWFDGVYLSKDKILDPTDVNLGSVAHNGRLQVDSTYVVSFEANIPPGLSGIYYALVRTDKNSNVYESGAEDNNLAYSDPASELIIPDPVNLVVTSIVKPDSTISGQPATVSWTVYNDSDNDVVGSWVDAIYLSLDTIWNYDDPLVGTAELTATLEAGKSYVRSATLNAEDFLGTLEDDMPGVKIGDYYVIARTDIRNNISETNESDNVMTSTDGIGVDVPTFSFGEPHFGSIATGERQYFRLNTGANPDDLRFAVYFDSSTAVTSMYVKFGDVPTLVDYDASYTFLDTSDYSVNVADIQDGDYYVMLVGHSIPSGGGGFELGAGIVAFGIDRIYPMRGGDEGFVTVTVEGTSFDSTVSMSLENFTHTIPTLKSYHDSASTTWHIFSFADSLRGIYDIVITKDGAGEVRYPNAFVVEPSLGDNIRVEMAGPDVVRAGGSAQYTVSLRNESNIDAQHLLLIVEGPDYGSYTLSCPSVSSSSESCVDCDMSTIGGRKSLEIVLSPGVPPGQYIDVDVEVTSISDTLTLLAFCEIFTDQELRNMIHVFSEVHRLRVLANHEEIYELVPELVGLAEDSSSWVDAYHEVLDTLYMSDFYVVGSYKRGDFYVPKKHRKAVNFGCSVAAGAVCGLAAGPWAGAACAGAAWFACDELTDNDVCKYYDMGDCMEYCERSGGSAEVCAKTCLREVWGDEIEKHDRASSCDRGNATPKPINPVSPRDPNEKHGPHGMEGNNLIAMDQVIPYTVYFENMPDASAPATDVTITDQLDPNLDWRRFRIGEISFGETTLTPPGNTSYWHTILDMDSLGLRLEIDAGIDVSTGLAHWYFRTTDPATGQAPLDPFAGFLPPNDSTGRGEGHVAYTIWADEGLPEGAEIHNSATIVFDINDAIETNEVANVLYRPKADLILASAGLAGGWTTLVSGLPAPLEVIVANVGTSDVESAWVDVLLEPKPGDPLIVIDSAIALDLSPSAEQAFTFSWVPALEWDGGVLHFVVDAENAVLELDDANNSKSFSLSIVDDYTPGDVNSSGGTPDISDLLCIADLLFILGFECEIDVMQAADVNCDASWDISDIVYLANYLFLQGPEPCTPSGYFTGPAAFASASAADCDIKAESTSNEGLVTKVSLRIDAAAAAFQQTYSYDQTAVRLDSIVPQNLDPRLPIYYSAGENEIRVGVVDMERRVDIAEGQSDILWMYFSVKKAEGLEGDWLDHISTIVVDSEANKMPVDVRFTSKVKSVPSTFALHQNYPNPFNASTMIKYDLPKATDVRVEIYNVLGQKVVTLVNGQQDAGSYQLVWEGTSSSDEPVSSGVYFYRIDAGDYNSSKKMVLLK